MHTPNSEDPRVEVAARMVQLVIERVYSVLGAATTQVLLAEALKEVARTYPFLHQFPRLGPRGEMPARIGQHFPGVAASELAAAMDALLCECVAAVRELTGDIMLAPLPMEAHGHREQPEP